MQLLVDFLSLPFFFIFFYFIFFFISRGLKISLGPNWLPQFDGGNEYRRKSVTQNILAKSQIFLSLWMFLAHRNETIFSRDKIFLGNFRRGGTFVCGFKQFPLSVTVKKKSTPAKFWRCLSGTTVWHFLLFFNWLEKKEK